MGARPTCWAAAALEAAGDTDTGNGDVKCDDHKFHFSYPGQGYRTLNVNSCRVYA